MPRIQRRFLLGSRWTAVVPLADGDRARHFEVVARTGEVVTLRAILDGRDYQLPIAALEDRACWSLGWRSLPATLVP